MGFYQRLLARDLDEAFDIAEQRLKETSLGEVYDEVLMPALSYSRRDLDGDLISEEEHKAILNSISEIGEDLFEDSISAAPQPAESDSGSTATPLAPVAVLACPAHDETDELALRLLARMLDPSKCDLFITAPSLLATEVAALVEDKKYRLICIGALPPGGLAHARYLCKRLRGCCPESKIVVGRFGQKSAADKNREQLQSAGADYVAFSLADAPPASRTVPCDRQPRTPQRRRAAARPMDAAGMTRRQVSGSASTAPDEKRLIFSPFLASQMFRPLAFFRTS